ncbi:MAG TPA: F0F1 ATP synthase subunit epsilon [Candidatus Paceibacterota bacterium]
MKLTISKIDEVLFSGEAESVTVPGAAGEMTVLSHHMPLITTLKAGKVIIKQKEGKHEEFSIGSGFLEVGKTETAILI